MSAEPLGVFAAMKIDTTKRLAKRFVLCGVVLFVGAPFVGMAFGLSGPHDSIHVFSGMALGSLIFVLGLVLGVISWLLPRNSA